MYCWKYRSPIILATLRRQRQDYIVPAMWDHTGQNNNFILICTDPQTARLLFTICLSYRLQWHCHFMMSSSSTRRYFTPCLQISRKLNAAEINFLAVELETLALIFTITQLKKYLIVRQFVIQCDNQPLRVIIKASGIPKSERIAEWANKLLHFLLLYGEINKIIYPT